MGVSLSTRWESGLARWSVNEARDHRCPPGAGPALTANWGALEARTEERVRASPPQPCTQADPRPPRDGRGASMCVHTSAAGMEEVRGRGAGPGHGACSTDFPGKTGPEVQKAGQAAMGHATAGQPQANRQGSWCMSPSARSLCSGRVSSNGRQGSRTRGLTWAPQSPPGPVGGSGENRQVETPPPTPSVGSVGPLSSPPGQALPSAARPNKNHTPSPTNCHHILF